MTSQIEVVIPNIGDAADIEVIEVLVTVGNEIEKDQPLLTLESDKASMEVPSDHAGIISSINVKIGDKVSEGDLILLLEGAKVKPIDSNNTDKSKGTDKKLNESSESESITLSKDVTIANLDTIIEDICIPDIGDASSVDVIDVLVKVGDVIAKDQALITLEGDKATMDIPSSMAGEIKSLNVNIGDKVSQGDIILSVVTSQIIDNNEIIAKEVVKEVIASKPESNLSPKSVSNNETISVSSKKISASNVYASPSVRRLAREFGVDLTLVDGSGRKARIIKEDIQNFVKSRLAAPQTGNIGLPKMPKIDFSKFGSIEAKPLNKIKRLTAQSMTRSWLNVPHVTQFDEADISELEAFRKANKESALAQGAKLTPLAFIVLAVVKALQVFPEFNSSLDETGENLILKQYYNIGIAVDTPNGLVVPVIRDAHKKGLIELAKDMAELGAKARNKALTPADMSGGTFTISSLGGIGGTAFTPIVNAPEVAILGVSRSKMQPVYNGNEFEPKLMLPLSLSYDHRVIDGAQAARFSSYLGQCLADIRTLLL